MGMARVPVSTSESQPLCISWKSVLLSPACPDKASVLGSCRPSSLTLHHCSMGPLWIGLLPMALALTWALETISCSAASSLLGVSTEPSVGRDPVLGPYKMHRNWMCASHL